MRSLPYFCRGEVVRGFGRGSKELGIPTGDGRMDSPGFCAQYCAYTAMENDSKKIIFITNIDKRETQRNSVVMEKEGFMRAFDTLCQELNVTEVCTDAHSQISALFTNFPDSVVEHLPADISTGIYYGWACVGNGDLHKMVMSIGWNPYYKNTKKSMETHVIHTFKEDFYGQILSVVMVGYIRPERSYHSLEALIAAINGDIAEAKAKLELPEHLKLREDNFFTAARGTTATCSSTSSSTSSTATDTIINGH